MNKGNLMVSSLNLFFLMQNIKMKCNFVFQVFFLTRSSFERNKTITWSPVIHGIICNTGI